MTADRTEAEPFCSCDDEPSVAEMHDAGGYVTMPPCPIHDASADRTEVGEDEERGITQTITLGDGSGLKGNCAQAAVASWFCFNGWDTDLEDVPDFANDIMDTWWEQMMYGYFACRSFLLRMKGTAKDGIPDEMCLLTGTSPRGVGHMVVAEHGRIIWDPHPSRAGLSTVGAAYVPVPATETWAIVRHHESKCQSTITSLRLQVEEGERERERLAGELWEMAGDRARLIEALRKVDAHGCTNLTAGRCSADPSRTSDSPYGATRWCDACIAAAALAPIEGDE